MTAIVLICISAIFLCFAAQPFVIYPASLALVRAFRKRKQAAAPEARAASFDVCFSAFNEEAVIVEKIENLLALKGTVPSCAIHVYVDAATDRTVERLRPYRDQIDVVVGEARRGKSYGLNQLVARCKGEIVVFTDANVMFDLDALVALGARFDESDVGCVEGQLVYINAKTSATSASGALYRNVEEGIKQLESDTFNVIGASGSIFAIRRRLHRIVPDDIIDDFYVSMRVLLDGWRVVREPRAIALERSATDTGDEFRRKVRIACQAFNVHKLLWPEIKKNWPLMYCYVSHRLLKWMLVFNLGLSGAFAVGALFARFPAANVSAALLAGCAGLAIAFKLGIKPAPRLVDLAISLVGVGWGVCLSVRGDRFQTWTPTTTARPS